MNDCVVAMRRRRPGETEDAPGRRQPVSRAHVDQTSAAAIARVHRHLPPGDVPAPLKKRFQIVSIPSARVTLLVPPIRLTDCCV